jgi:hypothetical protein
VSARERRIKRDSRGGKRCCEVGRDGVGKKKVGVGACLVRGGEVDLLRGFVFSTRRCAGTSNLNPLGFFRRHTSAEAELDEVGAAGAAVFGRRSSDALKDR